MAVTTADVGVGVGTPDVKGTLLVDLAPLKAGCWVAAAGFGEAFSLEGFRTLFASHLVSISVPLLVSAEMTIGSGGSGG